MNSRWAYRWGWVAFGGLIVAFIGMSIGGGEYLGGAPSAGDWITLVGIAMLGIGFRLRAETLARPDR